MKRVLVTGAAGFIGSHLSHALVERGIEVVCIDDFTDSYDPTEKLIRASRLADLSSVEFVRGDLASMDIHSHLKSVDTVFHLAGRAGVRSSFSSYPSYVHDNIVATTQLVRAITDVARPIRLVYASSSSVYGDAPRPFKETMDTAPISPYGKSKLASESLVLGAKSEKVSVVALRYFTVYGPEQRPDMGIRKFIIQALLNQEIEIYGDGRQSRDFTYVGDIVDATIRAGMADVSGIAINIGGGSTVTLLEVMDVIARLRGKELRLHFGAFAQGDVMHTGADLTRAKYYLDFCSGTSFSEGVAREYAWLEKKLSDVGALEVVG